MPSRLWSFLVLWMPLIIWATGILVLSTIDIPKIKTPDIGVPADKIAHFIMYVLLALFIIRPLRQGRAAMSLAPAAGIAFIGATGYGIIMEIYQSFVSRSMEFADALADAAGAGLAVLTYVLLSLIKERKRRQRSGEGQSREENRRTQAED